MSHPFFGEPVLTPERLHQPGTPFFPGAVRPDASAVGVRPPVAPGSSIGPLDTTPETPPPSLWDKIQHLPLIGRDASDQFRADIAQAWQGIKERLSTHSAETPIPYVGLALGAANLTGLGEEAAPLSQASRNVLHGIEDVAAGRRGMLPKFAILSADREGLAPEVLRERHALLAQKIRELGYEPVEHRGGIWRNSAGKNVRESGYIVPGMSASQAQHIAEGFQQEAVITDEGFHHIGEGTTAPLTGMRAPKGREPYTIFPSGKKVAMQFDFDRAQPSTYARGAGRVGSVAEPKGVVVYHATTKPGFSTPTRSSDFGPHVGTPGQADEILRGSPFDPPGTFTSDKTWRPEGSRVMKLIDTSTNPLRVKDANWGNPAGFADDLVKQGSITAEERAPLKTHADIRALLQKKGYDSLIYQNRVEADKWTANGRRVFKDSKVIFEPGLHLHNPLQGGPGGKPFLPEGAPSVLGASEPKFAYKDPAGTRHGLPLAEEDVSGLGVAGRHLLQANSDKESWLAAMKSEYPSYAPHLNGWAGDKAYAVAKRASFSATPRPEIERLARSAEGEATRPWYHTWWPAVQASFGNEDGEMLTRFHAVLSAQKSPEDNALMSLSALSDYKKGKLDFPSVGATPERVKALQRIAEVGPSGQARIAQEGPKVNNFYLALKGSPEAVVIDRHMARAYLGKEKLSEAEYNALDSRIRADARESGVSPRDYQAMVWGGQTKYPFQPPEEFLWQHLGSGHTPDLLEAHPAAAAWTQKHAAKKMLMENTAPSHAAVRVGDRTFEVPMNRGHAGALEKAIEALRDDPRFQPGGKAPLTESARKSIVADEIMGAAEDGYTHGDGKFIPRAAVEHLHSSDFVRAKRGQ